MIEHSDPTVVQSWLIAIPTLITAVSTWYLKRKTEKTGEKSTQVTKEAIADHTDTISSRLKELHNRLCLVEEAIAKTRDSQVLISQKHTETMKIVQSELAASRSMIQKLSAKPLAEAEKVTVTTPADPAQDNGKVIVVTEEPKKNFGKVIVKP